MLSTSDIVRHDACKRLQTWASTYETPRISIAECLNESLRNGLISGSAQDAYSAFMAKASSPGLGIEGRNVYDIAVHHARLIEVVCAYLLSGFGPWVPCGEIEGFAPESFQMDDGRIRRVILCSSWNSLREMEERNSWRSVADICTTGRPLLINVIVIGQSRFGFRPSPWTQAFIHPENKIMRVKRLATEKTGPNPKFSDNWKKVWREATDESAEVWLGMMQQDQAFEGIVESLTVDVPANTKEILSDFRRIMAEIGKGSTEMRRSSCFRYAPCTMASLCHGLPPTTPERQNWVGKIALA